MSPGASQMHKDRGGASETAQVIAELVVVLSDETLRDLHDLLQLSTASPSAGERREATLGLLVEILSVGTGQIPRRRDYDALQQQRGDEGQDWPDSEAIIVAYGHWLRAVRAAMQFLALGGASRTQARPTAARFSRAYSHDEVIFALRRFERWYGTCPTRWEFLEWGQLERRHARLHGLPDPRIPGMKQITMLFGSWDRALTAATTWAPRST